MCRSWVDRGGTGVGGLDVRGLGRSKGAKKDYRFYMV